MTTQQPTAEERKQQIAADFDALAGTYDALGFVVRTAERLVELAAPKPGERVLDLATGTGWAALAAAKAVGPSGHVLGTDIAEAALERARSKAALAKLENVEFRAGDAEAPALPDAAVDVVVCASAIFFLPHPGNAVGEWRRVTRPGGRVLFSSFGPGRLMGPPGELFFDHLARFVPAPPVPNRLARDYGRLLAGAGFDSIAVAEERLDYFVPDAEALWLELRGGWHALLRLTADQLEIFRRDYLADVERLKTSDGIRIEVPAIFASGVVPPA